MSVKLKLYHNIVPDADNSAYWGFAVDRTFRCDHCEKDHVETRDYFVGEQFCPAPDCTCREVMLTVFHLDEGVATQVAGVLVDLDNMPTKAVSWKDLDIQHRSDHDALRSVERHLQGASYRQTLAQHWSRVRTAKRASPIVDRRDLQWQKQRKKLRKALAKRRR